MTGHFASQVSPPRCPYCYNQDPGCRLCASNKASALRKYHSLLEAAIYIDDNLVTYENGQRLMKLPNGDQQFIQMIADIIGYARKHQQDETPDLTDQGSRFEMLEL